MARQMKRRIPAARHAEAISRDFLDPRGARNTHRLKRLAPFGPRDLSPRVKRHIKLTSGIGTAVNQGCDMHTRCQQVSGHIMDAVIVAKEHNLLPGRNIPTVHISAHRTRHHNAGAVVVLKRNRAFQSTRSQYSPLRRDLPEALFRQALGQRPVMRHTLKCAICAAVISPRHRRACHNANIAHCVELGLHLLHPVARGHPVNLSRLAQKPPTKGAVFFRKDHIRTRFSRRQSGHKPRRPRANNQHITMCKRTLVFICDRITRDGPKPRRTANDRLVKLFPKRLGPHECLVVKSSTKERRAHIVHAHEIKLKARPAVLAHSLQTVIYLLHGCAHVRVLRAALAHSHKRVRLFRASRQNPAWAVILERARNKLDTVGQQCRGQSIALKTLIGMPVKAKRHTSSAVDQALAFNPHARASFTSCASFTAPNSCVTVLRSATSQLPQPKS